MAPWQSANGTVDTSKQPGAEGVVDGTGTVVGYVKTSERELYPQPV